MFDSDLANFAILIVCVLLTVGLLFVSLFTTEPKTPERSFWMLIFLFNLVMLVLMAFSYLSVF